MSMKIKLIIVFLFFSAFVHGQTPSMFLKMETTAALYGQNLPVGTLLFDRETLKRYVVLEPLVSSKSIATSNKLLLDNSSIDRPLGGTAPAEIKEIGTNSSTHYLGELIAVDGGSGPADAIVVSIWTQDGFEKTLVAALTDASGTAAAWSVASSSAPSGWHLPTIWELTACFNNALIVNTILGSNGFKNAIYWSSTDEPSDATQALAKSFTLGQIGPYDKVGDSYFYRYVRIH